MHRNVYFLYFFYILLYTHRLSYRKVSKISRGLFQIFFSQPRLIFEGFAFFTSHFPKISAYFWGRRIVEVGLFSRLYGNSRYHCIVYARVRNTSRGWKFIFETWNLNGILDIFERKYFIENNCFFLTYTYIFFKCSAYSWCSNVVHVVQALEK